MRGNVVAGAERVGIRTAGQSCSSPSVVQWENNIVHSTPVGVAISLSFYERYGVPLKGGTRPCTLITGFKIWRCSHMGLYLNVSNPVILFVFVVILIIVALFAIVVVVFVLRESHINIVSFLLRHQQQTSRLSIIS